MMFALQLQIMRSSTSNRLVNNNRYKLHNNKQDLKKSVYIPLCGATVDLIWFAEKKSVKKVIGIEIVRKSIEEAFFQKLEIPYEIEEIEISVPNSPHPKRKILVFKDTKWKKIHLYCADMYDPYFFRQEIFGECVDLIWDRCSLVAVNFEDRPKYAEKMQLWLKKTAKSAYFLVGIEYDPNAHPGPPHIVDRKLIEEMYGGRGQNGEIMQYKEVEHAGDFFKQGEIVCLITLWKLWFDLY